MKSRIHHTGLTILICGFLSVFAGCGPKRTVPDNDAPVIYDFGTRLEHAAMEDAWTELDLGDPDAERFLEDGWGPIEGAPDWSLTRWATQRVASVRNFIPTPSDATLVVRCYPYSRSYIDQRMTVLVNGKPATRIELKRGEFGVYRIPVASHFFETGENIISFKSRYTSTRHQKGLRISNIALEGLQQPEMKPPTAVAEGGWVQQPNTRLFWQMVVPDRGSLSAIGHATAGIEDGEVGIYLRSEYDRREVLRSHDERLEISGTPLPARPGERVILEIENLSTQPVQWKDISVRGYVRPEHCNIVLMTIDSLRADHMGCYGYGRDTTPALDQLAERGTVFRKAYANSNESGPSHASLLTGRYPQSHGIIRNACEFQKQQVPVAAMFAQKGYSTAAYVNFGILGHGSRTGKGFEKRVVVLGNPKSTDFADLERNTYARGLRWMNKYWQDKQFVWIHSQFLHMDDDVGRYATMFWERPAPGQAEDAHLFPLLDPKEQRALRVRYNNGLVDLSSAEIDTVRDYYDGCLRMTDDHIKVFLQRLESTGLDPFTAIVVTSDHGVSLGQRGRISHIGPPYDHLLYVPLIFVLPGSGQLAGGHVESVVQLVDVAPTLLTYAGIRVPRRIQGTTLNALLEAPDTSHTQPAYAMLAKGRYGGPWFSIRTDDWRLLYSPNDPEILEYRPDPAAEPENVFEQHPDVAEKLKDDLMHWVNITPDVSNMTDKEMSDEVREMLEKAGYLDGSQ